jgi:hypothetical protein
MRDLLLRLEPRNHGNNLALLAGKDSTLCYRAPVFGAVEEVPDCGGGAFQGDAA